MDIAMINSKNPIGFDWLAPDNWWKTYLAGWFPLALAYLVILSLFIRISGVELISSWLGNIVVPIVMGAGVTWLSANFIVRQRAFVQIVTHGIGAVVFSALWALALFRLLQVLRGLSTGDWTFEGFSGPALAWQLFQGLTIYSLIVCASYAHWAMRRHSESAAESRNDRPIERLFLRSEIGFVPISFSDIVLIRAHEEGVSVQTRTSQHASRTRLGDLTLQLPEAFFLRIHRSILINLTHIHTIESAGNGRLTIHLSNGQSVETSRAGAADLKARLPLV